MCGIVGGISTEKVRNFIIEGLKSVEYRGYDSSGLALVINNKCEVYKTIERVNELDKSFESSFDSFLGIGHTRWATHGVPSVKNAHPHTSKSKLFTIVHNGVIENYRILKKELQAKGYVFKSDTDTEVVAHLLEKEYKITSNVLEAIRLTIKQLKGTYALAILFCRDQNHLYFAKNRSPLLIGHAKKGNFLASDYLPLLKTASDFVEIPDFHYGSLSVSEIELYDIDGNSAEFSYHQTNIKQEAIEKNNYPHFMLKEIEEAEQSVRFLIDNYFDGKKLLFDKDLIKTLKDAKHIIFLGSGTSYHACLTGARYFRELKKNVDTYIASEWAYYPYNNSKDTVFILMSQSGETADLISCVKLIEKQGSKIITITNTQGSTLARKADHVVFLYAGIEVAVASTKAYIAQMTALVLINAMIRNELNIFEKLEEAIVSQRFIIKDHEIIKKVAKEIQNSSSVYFLGRGYDHDLALECSLKLKEVSYIHSEAFPGGELKHGPIALIEKDVPVIVFISDHSTSDAMRSNICEIEARGGKIYVVSTQELSQEGDTYVIPNVRRFLSPLVSVMFGQYLAYYVALYKNLDIDKPRNLAKSVTVE